MSLVHSDPGISDRWEKLFILAFGDLAPCFLCVGGCASAAGTLTMKVICNGKQVGCQTRFVVKFHSYAFLY